MLMLIILYISLFVFFRDSVSSLKTGMVILSHGARKANKCIFRKETSIVTKSTQMKNLSVSLFQDGTQLWLNSSGTKCRTTRSHRAGVCVCKCAPSGGRLTNGNNKRSSPLISRQRLHGGSGGSGGTLLTRAVDFAGFVFGYFSFISSFIFVPWPLSSAVYAADWRWRPELYFAALNLH